MYLLPWPSPYGETAVKILWAERRDSQARQKTKMTNLLKWGPIIQIQKNWCPHIGNVITIKLTII